MKIYLHEFPSSEGICYEVLAQIRIIQFKYYVVDNNKYHSMFVRFNWGDTKVQLINIELLNVYVVAMDEELEQYREILSELFCIFHKFDEYWWLPKVQVPNSLAAKFYDLTMQLYLNP